MHRQMDTVVGTSLLGATGLAESFLDQIVQNAQTMDFWSREELLNSIREGIRQFEPLLAEHLSDAVLAGWVTGYDNVAQQFPLWLQQEFTDSIRRGPPNDPPEFNFFGMFDREPRLRLLNVENAAERLMERGIMTRPQFDAAKEDAQRQAFTIAGGLGTDTIDRFRFMLNQELSEGASLTSFQNRVEDILGTSPIAPGHLCFLPGTRIAGRFLAAAKLWYDGEVIEIKTSSGNVLRVTANHPILTASGWKDAGIIDYGDKVLCQGNWIKSFGDSYDSSANSGPSRRTVNNNDIPPFIEDVFESSMVKSVTCFDAVRPITPLDFYCKPSPRTADNCYVRGVRTYRFLMDTIIAKLAKLSNEFRFIFGSVSSPHLSTGGASGLLDPRCKRPLFTANGGFGRGGSRNSTRLIHSTPLSPSVFGPVTNYYSAGFKALDKSPGGDSQLFRNLMESFPGDISTDCITDIKRIRWSGHVYDIQSDTGFLVSEGIITSNSNVYRTNLQAAFRDGRETLRSTPLVAATFPYQAYFAVHDARARKTHRALEKLGLNGTNVYRADDPVWDYITPPLHYQCRCSVMLYTLEKAASEGVMEAQEWLRTGRAPINPDYRLAAVSQQMEFHHGWGHRGNVGAIVMSIGSSM